LSSRRRSRSLRRSFPWLKTQLASPDAFSEGLQRLPFYEEIVPLRNLMLEQAGEAVSVTSKFVVGGLSSLTLGTLNFFLMAFVILYSMYFLQMDGDKVVEKILYYLPLKAADERIMLKKFTSVTRATLKGTLVIGIAPGRAGGRRLRRRRDRQLGLLGHGHGRLVHHPGGGLGAGVDSRLHLSRGAGASRHGPRAWRVLRSWWSAAWTISFAPFWSGGIRRCTSS
jgi:hypothetical protein